MGEVGRGAGRGTARKVEAETELFEKGQLEAREVHRRGGEEFDEDAWAAFLEWARGYDDPSFGGRSRAVHEQWLAERRQPVLRLDSAAAPEALVAEVLQWEPGS